jgi:translation initiation factor 2B subunit (eIF-2B alpha/beta/delta family)
MNDYLDFYKELMTVMGGEEVVFSRQLFLDMHELKENILNKRNDSMSYFVLCHVAMRIVKVTKKRLPDSIHNRMLLGPGNQKVTEYVKFCERHKL